LVIFAALTGSSSTPPRPPLAASIGMTITSNHAIAPSEEHEVDVEVSGLGDVAGPGDAGSEFRSVLEVVVAVKRRIWLLSVSSGSVEA
jgi:hypothetical protein